MKKSISFALSISVILALVAWSPPNNEDILMPSGTPAVVIGTGNTVNGAAGPPATTAFRGYVAGNDNYIGTGSTAGYSAVLGNTNNAGIYSSVVAGNNNNIASGATDFQSTARYTGVFGSSNTIPQNRYSNMVVGGNNTADAHQSFVSGSLNTVNGPTVGGAPAQHSAAIGLVNHINAAHGVSIGQYNTVSGDWGVALGSCNTINAAYSASLGTWLKVDSAAVCAVGNYNATTVVGDVFVVGTGVSEATRRNSIRATDDGSVILGSATSGKVVLAKAQGDISMGAYAN